MLIGIGMTVVSLGVMAQGTDQHENHHPAGTAASDSVEEQVPAGSMDNGKMSTMHDHMNTMHENKPKPGTPEQCQTLMAEHMKLMQECMAMMKQMDGGMQDGQGMSGGMSDHQQMMEKHKEMMEKMKDCMPAAASR